MDAILRQDSEKRAQKEIDGASRSYGAAEQQKEADRISAAEKSPSAHAKLQTDTQKQLEAQLDGGRKATHAPEAQTQGQDNDYHNGISQ